MNGSLCDGAVDEALFDMALPGAPVRAVGFCMRAARSLRKGLPCL